MIDIGRAVLITPLDSLGNELCEVARLFYHAECFLINPEKDEIQQDDFVILHQFEQKGQECLSRFVIGTEVMEKASFLPEVEPERQELLAKRCIKRLSKINLYELLKKITGHQPPWGSLTGIRPTRLIYEKLSQGCSMEEACKGVMQEFDVSAEKVDLLRRIVQVQQTLPEPAANEADLYVSIPFCRTRCAYCSFPGEAVGKGKLVGPYLEALHREIEEARDMFGRCGLKLRAVYVGGGTPSALNEEQFSALMEKIMALYPDACEYTVEAGRPDTITRGKLETLKRLGVDRISINPQTMNDETLVRIGRDHTAAQTVEAFELAREMGFTNINMDVIAGLPGEGLEEFRHTMDEILRLKPDSLTVHTLAIKRSSRLNLEKYPLPDAAMTAEMVRMGEETASLLGMEPYYLYRQKYMAGQQQNVGYATPGNACLYNIDMMEETGSVIAVGAGAISKRVYSDRELRIERAPNVTNVTVYIDRIPEMIRRKEELFKA
ncbi:MAG: coproporphyrinogen dehydrogenase HemZ [Clostridiales bacterium]|nr:coproporphyrinogen dehydrogenase HemZ [Clostridiales bacterium]